MKSSELISDRVPSLKPTDTIAHALEWMNEFKIRQLPIVDDGVYKGLIAEDDILDLEGDASKLVADARFYGRDSAYIHPNTHIYDGINMMDNMKVELLPVVDEDNQFMGAVTLRDMIEVMGQLFAVTEPGGVIVLEVDRNSYVLSEIGRIVESADAKVLSLYLSTSSVGFYITLKLNVQDVSRVVAAFERFNYRVAMTFHRTSLGQEYERNYHALMRYLDI